jgi:hypothetical protein
MNDTCTTVQAQRKNDIRVLIFSPVACAVEINGNQ